MFKTVEKHYKRTGNSQRALPSFKLSKVSLLMWDGNAGCTRFRCLPFVSFSFPLHCGCERRNERLVDVEKTL